MGFTTDKTIFRRQDGTFVIEHEGFPYHVCSRNQDPLNIYDLSDVKAFADANPSLVKDDGPSLNDVKYELYTRIEGRLQELLYLGFLFDGQTYPADIQAQTAAIDAWQDYQETGDTSVLGAFCKANMWVPMTVEKFKEFRSTGRGFVRGIFARVWRLKHVYIAGSESVEDAKSFFENWMNES